MRRVFRDRVSPPPSLAAASSTGARELALHVEKRRLGSAAELKFAAYKGDDVRRRLEELFHGKCAYCESLYSNTAPVDIEHYRPKGAIEGRKDLSGYWWLAMEWSNLLPSCIDCNRRRTQITSVFSEEPLPMAEGQPAKATCTRSSGKKDAFPIVGSYATWSAPYEEPKPSLNGEVPLLLNPCEHEPSEHISFEVRAGSFSLILPVRAIGPATDRGTVSIDVFGLNRLGLVQARTRLLRQLEFLSMLAVRLFRLSTDETITPEMSMKLALLGDLIVGEMRKMAGPEQPYSALVVAWLSAFKRELEATQERSGEASAGSVP